MATSRATRRFLPYRHARSGLGLVVQACTLDRGRELSGFDTSRQLVELDNERWARAALHLELTVTQDTLDAVLPVAERTRPPVALIVALHCPDTRLRRGHTVCGAPLQAGSHTVDLVLDHDALYGAVLLTPHLVRTADAGAVVPGYAHRRGTRVAGARPWEIRIDRKRFAQGQYLNIRRTRFSEDELLRPFADTLYRLSCNQAEPILWLNADHEAVDQILSTRAAVGRRAQMREVFFDHVGHSVWTQLFLKTVDDLRSSADEDTDVPFDWQHGVLAALLPGLYPDEPDRDSRRRRLIRETGDDLSRVLEALDTELQRRNQLVQHMTRLIEASLNTRPTRRKDGSDP